ncbi:MAG: dihydrodipicolinate synthase family protein [Chloroflexi bacterium]|nr:dihydrodipicolinate synthase family protein [Chloroflexota bacterium]MCY3582475.1 dihydrodipicolinate synthase family protein [Chloroflexota bacterium]MCY3717370.1 dihydrodipicolinate synthase family protein [Chloroflexota bacterium]MDE2651110.1 dihydrodipicolinate synthase family protein [Chloroflexota bacterium]MXX49987.1 dihydrodipicolinate synthase family protein [Chloroflexota bacterium]
MNIYGIVPPMTTPFAADESVDENLLRAEVEHLVAVAGVHGLAVGGSTGEGHTLSTDELRQLVGAAVDVAAGRVPIIAGIIVDSTRQAIEKARALADLEVAALQVTPVHYLFRPSDETMFRHFAALAEAAAQPVIVYNVVPWSYCSPALLDKMLREIDGLVGVKQSAGDLKLLADLLLRSADAGLIMSAVDALLYPSFALGAHGAIAAILSAAPELCVQLWDAAQAGDQAAALELHGRLLPLWDAIMADNLPANVKTALALQGRPAGLPRMPMPASSPQQREAIQAALVLAGML